MTVLMLDHVPVVWVGLASVGLTGGVVSVTTMVCVAVVTAARSSVAVHSTLVVPSGSGDGRLLVKLTIELSVVAVASPTRCTPRSFGGVALEHAVDHADLRRDVRCGATAHLPHVAAELPACIHRVLDERCRRGDESSRVLALPWGVPDPGNSKPVPARPQPARAR